MVAGESVLNMNQHASTTTNAAPNADRSRACMVLHDPLSCAGQKRASRRRFDRHSREVVSCQYSTYAKQSYKYQPTVRHQSHLSIHLAHRKVGMRMEARGRRIYKHSPDANTIPVSRLNATRPLTGRQPTFTPPCRASPRMLGELR